MLSGTNTENKTTPIPNVTFTATPTASSNQYPYHQQQLYNHFQLMNLPVYLNSSNSNCNYSPVYTEATTAMEDAPTTTNLMIDYDLLNNSTSSNDLALLNITEDQLPTVEEFDAIVNNYLENLSTKKRDKALVDKYRYSLILQVLKDPRNTAISTAQFRFWVKKMFRLSKKTSSIAEYTVCHDNKPVATREEIYDILVHAHKEAHHGGRDKTSALVRKRYSWIPKELIARFVRHCPFCISRRNGCQASSSPTTTSASMATPMTATTTTGEEMEQQFNQHNLFFYPTATKPAAAASYYPNQYFQPLLDFTLSQHQQEEMAGAKPINNISFPNNTSTTTDFFYSSSFDHLQQSQERLTYSPKPSVSNSNNVFNLNSTTFYPYLYNGSDKSQQQDTTAAAVVAAAALAAVNSTNASTATLEQQQQQFIQLQQFQQQYQLQQHQQQQQQHQVLIAETPHYLQEQQKDLLYSPLTSGMLSGSASSSIIASPQPSLQEPTVYIETEEEEQQGEIREDNILTEQALNDLADLLQQQQRQFDEEEEARLREQEVQPQIPCPASPSIKSCATKSIMATSISSTIDNTTAPDVMSSTPRSPHTLMISQAY